MADTSHNPQEVSKVESVNHTFTWRHGEPDTVIVTGTFDGWSKENVMDRSTVSSEEQNHEEQVQFTKTVQIPVDLTPVLYKYVVDGKWAHDPLHETATGDDGIVNNVLHTQIKSDDHFTQEAQVESDTSLQEAVQPVMHEDNREDEAIDLGPVSAVKDEASDNEPSVPDDPSEVNSPDVPLIKGESEEVGVATQFQTESSPVNADSTDTPSGASKDLSGSASDDVAEFKTLEVTSVVTDDVTSSQSPAEGSSRTENSLPVTDDHAVSTIPKSLTDNVEANHESTTTALPETEDGAVVAAAEKQPTEAEQEPVNSNTQDSSVTPETDKAAKPVPQESAAKDIQESSESVVPSDRVTPNTECLEIIGHTDAAVNVEADKADVQAELPQHDVAGITYDDSLRKTVKDVGPKEITVNVPLDKEESTSVGSIPNQAEDPATAVDPTSTTKECPDEVGLGVTTSAPEDVISEVHNPAPCSQGDSEQTPSNPEDVVTFVANDNPVTMESKDEAESLDTNSLSEESTKPAEEQSEYDNPVSEPARLNEVNREPTSAEPEHSTSNNSIDNEEKRTEANGSVAEVLLAADTEEGEVASREIENTVIPDIPSEKKIGNEEDSGFVATESADAVEEISVPIHPVEDIAVVRDHISEETVTEAIATKGDSEAVSTLPDAVPAETDVTDQQPQVEQEVVAVEEISETDAVVPGTTDEVPEDPQTVADSISQSVEVERVEITTTDETAQISEEVKTTKTNSGEEAPEGVEKESTVPESTDKATESTEVSEESPATIDAAVDNVTNAEDIGEAISSQDTEVTIAAVTKAVKVEEDVAKENFQDESTETATTVAAAAEVVTETVKVVSERTIVEGVSDVPQSVDNACLQDVEEETGPEIVEESVIHNVSDDTAEGSTAEVVVEVSENVANSGISSEKVTEDVTNIDSIVTESTEVTTKPVELSEETSGAVESPDNSNAPAETASEVIATEVIEESVSTVPDAATAEAVVVAEQQQPDLVEVAVEEVLKTESVA
ncbi:Cruciform DNA binding protein, partial [Dispira parvispora]